VRKGRREADQRGKSSERKGGVEKMRSAQSRRNSKPHTHTKTHIAFLNWQVNINCFNIDNNNNNKKKNVP